MVSEFGNAVSYESEPNSCRTNVALRLYIDVRDLSIESRPYLWLMRRITRANVTSPFFTVWLNASAQLLPEVGAGRMNASAWER